MNVSQVAKSLSEKKISDFLLAMPTGIRTMVSNINDPYWETPEYTQEYKKLDISENEEQQIEYYRSQLTLKSRLWLEFKNKNEMIKFLSEEAGVQVCKNILSTIYGGLTLDTERVVESFVQSCLLGATTVNKAIHTENPKEKFIESNKIFKEFAEIETKLHNLLQNIKSRTN